MSIEPGSERLRPTDRLAGIDRHGRSTLDPVREDSGVTGAHRAGEEAEQAREARLRVNVRCEDVEGAGKQDLLAVGDPILGSSVVDATLRRRARRGHGRWLRRQPIRTLFDDQLRGTTRAHEPGFGGGRSDRPWPATSSSVTTRDGDIPRLPFGSGPEVPEIADACAAGENRRDDQAERVPLRTGRPSVRRTTSITSST